MLLVLEGISWASLGEFEKARASLEKSLSYARGIEDLASIAVALHFHGTMFWLQGDGKTAARYLQEALPSLEKVGNVMLLGGCWANLGLACLLQGDYQAAAQHIDKGLEIQQNCGVMAFLANFYWVKGWLETETGHLVEARRDLEESLRLAMAHKERCSEAGAKIYLGRAMGKGEDPNYIEAEQSLRDGMRIFEELRLKPCIAQGCLFLSELYIDTGHKAKALQSLTKAEKSFSEMGMDYWLQRTQGLLEKLQA
jgi:tetratricopeptide (TPR) repeat protein